MQSYKTTRDISRPLRECRDIFQPRHRNMTSNHRLLRRSYEILRYHNPFSIIKEKRNVILIMSNPRSFPIIIPRPTRRDNIQCPPSNPSYTPPSTTTTTTAPTEQHPRDLPPPPHRIPPPLLPPPRCLPASSSSRRRRRTPRRPLLLPRQFPLQRHAFLVVVLEETRGIVTIIAPAATYGA